MLDFPYGDVLYTADFAAADKAQKIVLDEDYYVLACRPWLIFFNNPTFDSLLMKLYSERDGAPGDLLFTSSSLSKADIIAEANGLKELYFEFNAPFGVPIQGGRNYYISLSGSGYVGDDSSHIAWKKAFPDCPVDTDQELDYAKVLVAPRQLTLIGGPR